MNHKQQMQQLSEPTQFGLLLDYPLYAFLKKESFEKKQSMARLISDILKDFQQKHERKTKVEIDEL